MSTPTVNLGTLPSGYDNTSDFPSEPAGWGQPGQVRHAEAIGHGVWLAEHPADLDATPVDDLESWHDTYDPGGRIDQLIEKHLGAAAKCPIPLCARDDHPVYEMCEGDDGHTWFQGEPHDATKETNR